MTEEEIQIVKDSISYILLVEKVYVLKHIQSLLK